MTPGEVNRSTCDAGSQVGQYGKNYGGVDPGPGRRPRCGHRRGPTGTGRTKRRTWRFSGLQIELSNTLSFDNKAYTYFYKNFTISPEDTSTPCTGAVAQPGDAVQRAGHQAADRGQDRHPVAGDIPGYTKLNQYRNSGDISEFTWLSPIGVAKAGAVVRTFAVEALSLRL